MVFLKSNSHVVDVVATEEVGWTPTQNFVQMSRFMILHIHQEGMERYITYTMRLARKSREAVNHSKDGLRAPERETDLAFLWWLGMR